MSRVRVKIEGLRDAATAQAVAGLGADAIGLVLAPSPRRVEVEQAAAIAAALPPGVLTVGVFVNASAEEINLAARRIGLHYVQLHGDEPPQLAGELERPCIKAFAIRDERWAEAVLNWLEQVPPRHPPVSVLLDAYCPVARGGTGKTFNWQLVAKARQAGRLAAMGPIILAGGLNPSNVREAIEIAQPWAVDVASGVESSPGVKDLAAVERFIQAVRDARG